MEQFERKPGMTNEQQALLSTISQRVTNVQTWETIEKDMAACYEQYGCIPDHLQPKRRGRAARAKKYFEQYTREKGKS